MYLHKYVDGSTTDQIHLTANREDPRLLGPLGVLLVHLTEKSANRDSPRRNQERPPVEDYVRSGYHEQRRGDRLDIGSGATQPGDHASLHAASPTPIVSVLVPHSIRRPQGLEKAMMSRTTRKRTVESDTTVIARREVSAIV